MFISVVIPTFQRPDYLIKAFQGLRSQTRQPDQVVIGVREGDEPTIHFLASCDKGTLPIETVFVNVPGVIASMNAAIAKTTGDLVCLLDDDAEPLPDWIEKVEQFFIEKPKLGALGGRDLLQDHPDWRPSEPTTEAVGILTKFGRIIGNHHKGSGPFREVDLLKGCNIGIRGQDIRQLGLETALLGQGAQVHWELALCLDIKQRGYFVAYDPSLQIIHHIAPRSDDDQVHRGKFSRQGLYDLVYNENYVVHSRLKGSASSFHLVWAVLVGTLAAPGLVQCLRGLLRREKHMGAKTSIAFRATLKGTRDGKRAFATKR